MLVGLTRRYDQSKSTFTQMNDVHRQSTSLTE